MPPLAPVILWTAGIAGGIVLVKLIRSEQRRVNDELAALRAGNVTGKAERARHPSLKRDPLTGIYRP